MMLNQLRHIAQNKVAQATTAFASTTLATVGYTHYQSQSSSNTSSSQRFSSFSSIKSFIPNAQAATQNDENQTKFGGLLPERFQKFKLLSIDPASPTSSIYYFQLSDPSVELQLPVASYVLARADVNMEAVIRPYTPLGSQIPGELPLLVKSYPDGKMGQVFGSLQPGDEIELKGPLSKYQYKPNEFDRITFIAGGTGLTPMFQIIDHIINNQDDHTKMHLLYANTSQSEILLRPVLDDIAVLFGEQFKVTYLIDKPEAGWHGPTGYITKELLTAVAGPANRNERHKIFVCGPPAMVDAVAGPKGPNYTQGELSGMLKELNYTSDDVFKF